MIAFRDRHHAGKFLAQKLAHLVGKPDLIVLALPRGGVPVGYEVAQALMVPLDVFVVRKLGLPGYGELAIGAIASGGVRVLNEDLIAEYNIDHKTIDSIADRESIELERRERLYRGGMQEHPDIRGKSVILVDDGLATGASMKAAIMAVKALQPSRIIVAVPVASKETCDYLSTEVDEIVCGQTPEPFFAVGAWYQDFSQTSDDEVRELLQRGSRVEA
jgi:putative phosphoribosyl transferase